MTRHLGSFAAIGWSSTSDTVGERVHQLAVPLREQGAAFTQATYRAQSLDRSTITSLQVTGGASEYIADVRYDDDPQSLVDLLRAGNGNQTLNYYPDVRDPTQVWAMKLISPTGDDVETQLDQQRGSFGDMTVQLRLRRTAGPIAQQQGTNVLFWYRGGGSLEGFTYSRATATTRIDKGRGVYAAVLSGQAATSWFDLDGDGIRETPAFQMAPARTNLVLQSENFGTTWAAVGTPTRSAAVRSAGTVMLDLIGDDSAAALEGYTQTVTFTVNAVKAVSLVVAQGTSTSSVVRLQDNTAGATRLRGTLTWSGAGLPSMSMVEGTFLGYERLTNGCFRLHFQTTSVTAANTNSVQVYPATDTSFAVANVGTFYAGGVQAEDALYPGPYIPTTTGTVTRNQDAVSAVFGAQPQAMSLYVRFVELGATRNNAVAERIVNIGGTTGARIRFSASGPAYTFISFNAAGSNVSSVAASTPVLGDTVELLGTITATGVVQLTQGINGVAATATASAAQALDPAWNSAALTFGENGGNATAGILNAVVVRGVQDMQTMRRIAKV